MGGRGKSSGTASSGRGTRPRSNAGSGSGGDFKSPLSRAEKNALENMSGNYFALINARLRGIEKSLSPILRNTLKNAESALSKASLSRSRLLFRGVSSSSLHAQVVAGTLKKGSILTEKGFMSTSEKYGVARNFAGKSNAVIFRIQAPKGSKGAKLGGLSNISHGSHNLEREVMFQRGSKLRVVKSQMKGNVAVVTVKLGKS